MFERLRTLAISVETPVMPEAAVAGDKVFWIILIAALIVVTIVLAVVLTRIKKRNSKKAEQKAKRKPRHSKKK